MSTYSVLSLMIQFGLLIIAVITVSSSKDKKK
ncbi:MAG: putative holin-like toxin [Sporolactobacillus sp.]